MIRKAASKDVALCMAAHYEFIRDGALVLSPVQIRCFSRVRPQTTIMEKEFEEMGVLSAAIRLEGEMKG